MSARALFIVNSNLLIAFDSTRSTGPTPSEAFRTLPFHFQLGGAEIQFASCPRAVVGPLRSPRDRSSALALLHEVPVDSFVDRQYHNIHHVPDACFDKMRALHGYVSASPERVEISSPDHCRPITPVRGMAYCTLKTMNRMVDELFGTTVLTLVCCVSRADGVLPSHLKYLAESLCFARREACTGQCRRSGF
jgi:hypothetical protein